MVKSDLKQKAGKDFLGRLPRSKSSNWGQAVHQRRRQLWSGPEGHAGCCPAASSVPGGILCLIHDGHQGHDSSPSETFTVSKTLSNVSAELHNPRRDQASWVRKTEGLL